MQSYSRRTESNKPFLKRVLTWTAVFIVAGFSIVTCSSTVHASLMSFMSSLMGSQQASAQVGTPVTSMNSETIGLPTYAASINPHPVLADSFVPVDNGDTLSADLAASESVSSDGRGTQITNYVVQPDDTLSSIAVMFDISVDTIKQVNGLTKNTIRSGQTLKILPVDGLLYTVQKGDSAQKIANKFKVDVNDIYVYNDLSVSSIITVGQQLIIPHGQPSVAAVSSYLATQKPKVPSSEPLLDAVWNWPSYPGYWSCPVPGAVLTQGLHGHNAVDLAIARGTPIHASAAGTVVASRSNGLWNGGYGNFVLISHPNGVETLYAHMSATAVSVGKHVSTGETIGYVGMTGLTTGPHVHFEIRGAQNPFVDPSLCR